MTGSPEPGGGHVIQVDINPALGVDEDGEPFFGVDKDGKPLEDSASGNDEATRSIGVGSLEQSITIDYQDSLGQPTPTLLVDADGNGDISPGDTIQYTITYENKGTTAVTNAAIIDDFDETLLEEPFNITAGGFIFEFDGIIVWNLGTIPAGEEGFVTYDVMIKPAEDFPSGTDLIANTAFLTTDQTVPIGNMVEFTVGLDTTPPTTTAALTPNANDDGWNNTDVSLVLSAVDDLRGSGVSRIVYSIDGGQDVEVQGNTVTLQFTDEGMHTVTYHAVDAAFNEEEQQTAQVNIDTTAPQPVHSGPFEIDEGTSILLDGTASTDSLSGILSTAWSIDGDNVFDDGDPALFIGRDGPSTHNVSLQVIDVAGNVGIATTQVVVTDVPPTVFVNGPTKAVVDQVILFTLSATDPSTVDLDAGYSYEIFFGDGKSDTILRAAGNADGDSVGFEYETAGTFVVRAFAKGIDDVVSPVTTFEVVVGDLVQSEDPKNILSEAISEAIRLGDSSLNFLIEGEGVELNAILGTIEMLDPNPFPEPEKKFDIIVDSTAEINRQLRNLLVPVGFRLILEGGVYEGGSPAFTLIGGEVIVNGGTFTNSTAAPTILVNGGKLTIRDSTIEETTGGEWAAIEIVDGTVDLGTTSDPGGNTIIIKGAGELIHNTGTNPVSAIGNTFQLDATTLTSIDIEDEIFHALDAGGGGLVTYVADNVYVTVNEGTPFDVDLRKLVADVNLTSPTFSIIASNNGTATLLVDAFTGRFVAGDDGSADFRYQATASGTSIEPRTVNFSVNNVAPDSVVIDDAAISTYVLAIGESQPFDGSFSDVGIEDTHSAEWTLSHAIGLSTETETRTGTLTQGTGSGTVNDSFSFSDAGVYTVTLTITDDDTGETTSDSSMFVVYDPSEGFVTGGGWFISPVGAYIADTSLTGKANFGFVAKYKKGSTTLTGQTEFQFKTANLNFHSDEYIWLVIAGARAQYQGTGTINGSGNYGFKLTAIDGQVSGGGGVDRIRLEIWDKDAGDAIVYDSGLGATDDSDPSIILGGGKIIIHSNPNNLEFAGAASAVSGGAPVLTEVTLQGVVTAAIQRWAHAGVDADELAALSDVDIQTAALSGSLLGVASSHTIWIDVDAAGHGWFIDATPFDDNEFLQPETSGVAVDLLSVVGHELGHVLGFDHTGMDDVMFAALSVGERHVVAADVTANRVAPWTTSAVAGPGQPNGFGTPVFSRPAELTTLDWSGSANSFASFAVTVSPAVRFDNIVGDMGRVLPPSPPWPSIGSALHREPRTASLWPRFLSALDSVFEKTHGLLDDDAVETLATDLVSTRARRSLSNTTVEKHEAGVVDAELDLLTSESQEGAAADDDSPHEPNGDEDDKRDAEHELHDEALLAVLAG